MSERIGDVGMPELVAEGQQLRRHHPLAGLGQFAGALPSEEKSGPE
jgi:hypothetical protein